MRSRKNGRCASRYIAQAWEGRGRGVKPHHRRYTAATCSRALVSASIHPSMQACMHGNGTWELGAQSEA
jgi:hypothetical protein